MSIQVYIDGVYYPKEQAKVSVFDHGYLYGDGIFEGIRAYNGRVWKLAEHIKRLYEGGKAIMLQMPITPAEMTEAILETLRRNNLGEAYVRVVVSRGAGDLGLDPRKCPKPSVVVIADKISLFPQELYDNGLRVVTVATRRNSNEALNPRMKSLNYLNNIMAKIEANNLGYPEVLMLNNEGYVTEGTGDNVFIVKNGELLTPPKTAGILEGI
ncbi:MAG: aminotransferase class IV, partial [Bacillota bacterium]